MKDILTKKNFGLLVLALLAGINFFTGLGRCGLFDMDEAVYSEVSREMAGSGGYIVPHFNGKPFLEKPAMFYWAQALSFKFFGAGEIPARLPSAAASFLLIIISYFLVKKLFGEKTALFSSLALAFNVQMGILSKAATTDAILFLFISVSVLSFMSGYYYLFYVCAALAGLVKGPVGFLIPFGVVIISAAVSGRLKDLKNAKPLTGILIFLAILLPWYIAVSARTNGEFLKEFFLKQNFARFGKPLEGHSGGIFYYIPVILLGFFPWSAFLFSAFRKFKFTDKKNIYLAVWAILPFLVFSISGTKLPNYILPVFAPLAIITGMWLKDYYKSEEKTAVSLSVFIFLAAVISGFLFVSDPLIKAAQLKFNNPYLRQNISLGAETRIFAGVFFVLSLAAVVFALKNFKNTFLSFVAGLGLMFGIFSAVYLVPKGWSYIQGGLYELSAEVRASPGCELVIFNVYNPSINFYSQKIAEIIPGDKPDMLLRTVNDFRKNGKEVCIISDDSLESVVPGGFSKTKSVPGYALFMPDRHEKQRETSVRTEKKRMSLYRILRNMDIRMFLIINDYPGYRIIDYIMGFFTTLGNGFLLLPAVAAVFYLHDKKRFAFNFLFFLILVTAGGLVVQILKFVIDSPRPLKRLNDVRVLLGPLREHGFPSGHTQAAFAAALFLSTKIKKLAVLFFTCAFLVGYSRIYVGAHFPSDVFAGAVVGVLTTGVLIIFFEEKVKKRFEKNL